MGKKEQNIEECKNESEKLIVLCHAFDLKIIWISRTHCRIEDTLDIFPLRKKYHDLKKNERGIYDDSKKGLSLFLSSYFKEKISS